MVIEFQGITGSVAKRKFAIVVSRYHDTITGKLLAGAIQTLQRNAVLEEQISVVRVPGAWELVDGAQQALLTGDYDAVICLGCVIRGETTHDQHINTTVANGLGRLGLEHQCPVAFGLLTCNTMDQAIQRSGGEVGNKGIEAAEAAIEMLQLRDALNR